jgi:anthranilate phosphoribosyltransferase
MGISRYLKQIGRGSKGASDLTRADAQELFGQIIEKKVTDLEVGAFCLAMRIKGETAQELAGFYDAILPYLPKIQLEKPTLLLPSYNGARKALLFTPLVAKILSERGMSVLVHGMHEETSRLSSAEIFEKLQWPMASSVQDLVSKLSSTGISYCSLQLLCPELAEILEIRHTLGLRNSAHILAKLLNPVFSTSLQICNYTHPAYPSILDDFFQLHPSNVILMRGNEGEPVASIRRLPELHIRLKEDNVRIDTEAVFSEMVQNLLDTIDVNETTQQYRDFLSGKALLPLTIVKQVELVTQVMKSVTRTQTGQCE